MTNEPQNLTTQILREIQATLTDHGRQFAAIREELSEIHEGQDEFLKNSVYALGNAAAARHRVEDIETEIDALKRRLDLIEEKL